ISIVIIWVLLLPGVSFGAAVRKNVIDCENLSPSLQMGAEAFRISYINLKALLKPPGDEEISALFDKNEPWHSNKLIAEMIGKFKEARRISNPNMKKNDAQKIERIMEEVDADEVETALPLEGKRLLYYFLVLRAYNYARLGDAQRSGRDLEKAVNLPCVFANFDNYYDLVFIFRKLKNYEKAAVYTKKALAIINTLPKEQIAETEWGVYSFYYGSLLDWATTVKNEAFRKEGGEKQRELKKARRIFTRTISVLEKCLKLPPPLKEEQFEWGRKQFLATMISCYAQIVSIDNKLEASTGQLKDSLNNIDPFLSLLMDDIEQANPQVQYLAGKVAFQLLQAYMRLVIRIIKSGEKVDINELFPAEYFERFTHDFTAGKFKQDLKAIVETEDDAAYERVLNALIKDSSISRQVVSLFDRAKKNFESNPNFSDLLLLLFEMRLHMGMFSKAEQDMSLLCKKFSNIVRTTNTVQDIICNSYAADKENTADMVERFLTNQIIRLPLLIAFKDFKAMDNEYLKEMLQSLAEKNKKIERLLIKSGLFSQPKKSKKENPLVLKPAKARQLTLDEQLTRAVDTALERFYEKRAKKKKSNGPAAKIKKQDVKKFSLVLTALAEEFNKSHSRQLFTYLKGLISKGLIYNKEILARTVVNAFEKIANEQGLELLEGFQETAKKAEVSYDAAGIVMPVKEKIEKEMEAFKKKEACIDHFLKNSAKQAERWKRIYEKIKVSGRIEAAKLFNIITAEEPVLPDNEIENQEQIKKAVDRLGGVVDEIEAFVIENSYIYSSDGVKRIRFVLKFNEDNRVWNIFFEQIVPELKYIAPDGRQEISDIFKKADALFGDFDMTVLGFKTKGNKPSPLLEKTIKEIAAEVFELEELIETSLRPPNTLSLNKVNADLLQKAI
ncbi:MAG: hypothetical protein L6416_10680, partial [Candidatus Omnitrophica bacterium]|nr:hypothetical protein [Candidatus Omnitrophota bacterium]